MNTLPDDVTGVFGKPNPSFKEMEDLLGEARAIVVDEGEYLFAIYGNTIVHDKKYDPRPNRNMLVLTPDEWERVEK